MSGHNWLEWCRLSICPVNKWWKERCNRKAWHREAEQEMWNASCQRDWRSLSLRLTQAKQFRQLALLLQDMTDLPNPCSYGDEIYKNIYIKKHLEGQALQAWIQQPETVQRQLFLGGAGAGDSGLRWWLRGKWTLKDFTSQHRYAGRESHVMNLFWNIPS